MLGIVCSTPTKPNTVPDNFFLLAIKIPKGTPIATAINNEIKVKPMCASNWSKILPACSRIKLKRDWLDSFIPLLFIITKRRE